ncbi:MAG: nuclear transport factor 2 family protein [Novosphingobium sp.]|nr:nuclear transport factor 2 family protein [Novosphingobium sp.]
MGYGDDIAALNQLAYRYAAAVDACDMDMFKSVFTQDARLRAYNPGQTEPFNDIRGHDELVKVNEIMATMFDGTMHTMTNHLVTIDGDTASGQVLCIARHIPKGEDNVLIITLRYEDDYARSAGEWKICDRHIRFLWAERGETTETGF